MITPNLTEVQMGDCGILIEPLLDFDIIDISYALGERSIDVATDLPDFAAAIDKTGIRTVHETDGSSLDLAEQAARKLLERSAVQHSTIACTIVVTQSAPNVLPSTACLLQDRLGLSSTSLAFDINQGCSGFVQGLILANSLLGTFPLILLICVDTYRKKLRKDDRSTMTVFSDGASATLIRRGNSNRIVAQSHYTDGSGSKFLIQPITDGLQIDQLYMGGADVFLWTKRVVTKQIKDTIDQCSIRGIQVEALFAHQASKLVLDSLRSKLPPEISMPTNFEHVGNTTSSSIPILISENRSLFAEKATMLAGFGVGLSSSCVVIEHPDR